MIREWHRKSSLTKHKSGRESSRSPPRRSAAGLTHDRRPMTRRYPPLAAPGSTVPGTVPGTTLLPQCSCEPERRRQPSDAGRRVSQAFLPKLALRLRFGAGGLISYGIPSKTPVQAPSSRRRAHFCREGQGALARSLFLGREKPRLTRRRGSRAARRCHS